MKLANLVIMDVMPENSQLPMFVYGTLKPGELAHSQIKDLVAKEQGAGVAGFTLAVVDGIPYALPAEDDGWISGSLLSVKVSAYQKVSDYEQVPHLYCWTEVETNAGRANMLVSSRPEITRSRHELRDRWTVLDDTFMVQGVPWVFEKIEALGEKEQVMGMGAREGYLMIELQSIFMILWTLFERILLFTYGVPAFGESIRKKLDKVRDDSEWLSAISAANVRHVRVRPHGTPDRRKDHATDFCFDDWVAMRNNIVHRGKAALVEYKALKGACTDMATVLRKYLEAKSPQLSSQWRLDK